jgi:YHS domain-containing protein
MDDPARTGAVVEANGRAVCESEGNLMRMIRWSALSVLVLGLFCPELATGQGESPAKDKALVNVDSRGVGAHGYDPVALFADSKAVKGDPRYQSSYAGAIYYFHSAANKDAFDKEPVKYVPQYGGHCAMAMAMGQLEDADPNYFVVHDGKLLLQRNQKAHMMFAQDLAANHRKADENWAKLQRAATY